MKKSNQQVIWVLHDRRENQETLLKFKDPNAIHVRFDDYPIFFKRSLRPNTQLTDRQFYQALIEGKTFESLYFSGWPELDKPMSEYDQLNQILSIAEAAQVKITFISACKKFEKSLVRVNDLLAAHSLLADERFHVAYNFSAKDTRSFLAAELNSAIGFSLDMEVGT